jgi:hypothetical protein
MERITRKHLERLADHINRETGAPREYWAVKPAQATESNKCKTNAGHYYIDGAYGGFSLERLSNGGGASDVLTTGHVPARELFNLIHAYLAGHRDAQYAARRAKVAA